MSQALVLSTAPTQRQHVPHFSQVSACYLLLLGSWVKAPFLNLFLLVCFLIFHYCFSSSEPYIKCLLQFRLTLEYAKDSFSFIYPCSFQFCTKESIFFLFQVSSLLGYLSSSIPPLCGELLFTMKFTVLILWVILPLRPSPVLTLLWFCHLDQMDYRVGRKVTDIFKVYFIDYAIIVFPIYPLYPLPTLDPSALQHSHPVSSCS